MDQLDEYLPIYKIKADQWTHYELKAQDNPWMQKLLEELNEHSQLNSLEESLENSFFQLEVEIKKLQKPNWDQYILLKAKYHLKYNTRCVKSLSPMTEELNESFIACIVSHRLKSEEEFKDQTEIFTQGEIYQLYFLEPNSTLHCSEVLHEQIFLNVNPFPQISIQPIN